VEQDQNVSETVNPDEVLAPGEAEIKPEDENTDFISQPAKVMRIGSMVKSLLDEARSAPVDEAGRARLREIYETSINELSSALSPDLAERTGLPQPYLEQILLSLKGVGLVRSKRRGAQ
jgi:hypothetical protein